MIASTFDSPHKKEAPVSLLQDPRLFNFIIMALYFSAACWWAFHGKWVDTFYWLSALAITLTVTFGYSR